MKTNRNYIQEFIVGLIEKKSKLPKDCDLEVFDYIESGYVDSMELIKFIVDIESEFDIFISEDDMEKLSFRTIGGLVNIIWLKL